MNARTPDNKRLIRLLTGAFLIRPDPVGWLAAADLFEEMNEPYSSCFAEMWRERGTWFQPISDAIEEAAASKRVGPIRVIQAGARWLHVSRSPQTVRIEIRCGPQKKSDSVGWRVVSLFGGHSPLRDTRERYTTKRILDLMDKYGRQFSS